MPPLDTKRAGCLAAQQRIQGARGSKNQQPDAEDAEVSQGRKRGPDIL
jgi:hypothetical protein